MSEEWVMLVEAEDELEADIIRGFLLENGIPSRKEDSSPYTGAMRVIGGAVFEVWVMVPHSLLEQAKALLDSAGKDSC